MFVFIIILQDSKFYESTKSAYELQISEDEDIYLRNEDTSVNIGPNAFGVYPVEPANTYVITLCRKSPMAGSSHLGYRPCNPMGDY